MSADQSGTVDFLPAQQVQQIILVRASQTVSFTSSPPAAAQVNGAVYTPTAVSSPAGQTVIFQVDPVRTFSLSLSFFFFKKKKKKKKKKQNQQYASVCFIGGGFVTFQSIGTCVLTATALASTNFATSVLNTRKKKKLSFLQNKCYVGGCDSEFCCGSAGNTDSVLHDSSSYRSANWEHAWCCRCHFLAKQPRSPHHLLYLARIHQRLHQQR